MKNRQDVNITGPTLFIRGVRLGLGFLVADA